MLKRVIKLSGHLSRVIDGETWTGRKVSIAGISRKLRNSGLRHRPGRRVPMDLPLLGAAALAAFAGTSVFLPWLIRSLQGTSAVGIDINKSSRPRIPEMGGLAVMVGFYIGVSVFTILTPEALGGSVVYAALTASLGAGVVGLMDDMFSIRKRTKAVLPFILALPLGAAVYSSGDRSIFGIDIGLLMVVAVALGITSAANATNMLEGLNGLGAGLTLIIAATLVLLGAIVGAQEGLFLLFPLMGCLAAFLLFNRYPARVFPGDSMTLFAGATLAAAAIISNPPLKAAGAVLFLPMIMEFLLKARGRFKGENYGDVLEDGHLVWQGRVESLVHMVMRWRRLKESQIVAILWGIEATVCAIVVLAVWVGP